MIQWSFRPEELTGPVHDRFCVRQVGEGCGPVWALSSVGGGAPREHCSTDPSGLSVASDICTQDTALESSVHRNMQVT